jgi:hypothetical protein
VDVGSNLRERKRITSGAGTEIEDARARRGVEQLDNRGARNPALAFGLVQPSAALVREDIGLLSALPRLVFDLVPSGTESNRFAVSAMRTLNSMRYGALLAVLLFASGCASSVTGSNALIAPANTSLVQAISGASLYAGGPNVNEVDAYPAFTNNPQPDERILAGLDAPTGIAVDQTGNVYVCNNAGQSVPGKGVFWTVTVYRRGQTSPFRTYTDDVFSPVDVAVAADETVYVANFSSVVTVYPPGHLRPSHILRAPPGYAPLGVAVDAARDAFVSYVPRSGGGGRVYEYAPGRSHGSDLGITFSASPHGLAIDGHGDLIVAVSNAPNSGSSIEVFAPGQKRPKLTITGPFQPFMVALSRSGRRLFVADYGTGNNDGGVFVYAYPAGTLLFKDTQGTAAGAYGVAIDPSAP